MSWLGLPVLGGLPSEALLPSSEIESEMERSVAEGGTIITSIEKELEQVQKEIQRQQSILRHEAYLEDSLRKLQLLRNRRAELRQRIQTIDSASRTNVYIKHTGWGGLASWAAGMHHWFGRTFESLIYSSALGASFTFCVLLCAARGDIGLIAWACALFTFCLHVSVIIQATLLRLKDQKVALPLLQTSYWTRAIGVASIFATLSLTSAVLLLCVAGLRLHYSDSIWGGLSPLPGGCGSKHRERPDGWLKLEVADLVIGVIIVQILLGFRLYETMKKTAIWDVRGPERAVVLEELDM